MALAATDKFQHPVLLKFPLEAFASPQQLLAYTSHGLPINLLSVVCLSVSVVWRWDFEDHFAAPTM